MIAKDERVRVWAIPAKTGGSRAFCDRMNSWAQGEGQPGLGYIFFREGEGAGRLPKISGRSAPNKSEPNWGWKTVMRCFSALACQKPLPSLRAARTELAKSWS